ncbi:FtsK/SpoIIIE domain-containing protein [Solirubrobacter ginsenosidimutans]|uniref:FtsK/SpoIIIE domain-containing protein n=1 Tax=Solirubrobacter ginsenosidimutans TaxID=490573 RepID=A0A9X3MQS9_9ACTN|nr:FtsK/SpoIIIE domain-containing protein [Solirubrobacter ginsenosidimutans]MDA0160662.1 FtsK/SpoIIIE domain-containing protein [Solirubrobacter ginsenosidimutans]
MFRRTSVVHLVDELGRAQRRERAREDVQLLLVGVAWALWGVRVELVLVVALAAMQRWVSGMLGDVVGGVAVAVIIAAAMLVRPVRCALLGLLRAMRLRRAWARATIDSGVASGPFRAPGVWSVTRVPAGELLDVHVRRGQSVAELDNRSEHVAACLRAREVRVLRDRRDAARASVLVVRRDPFEGADPIAWPMGEASAVSLWEPIPVGVDEQGEGVVLELVERNILLGGEPGAGKSAALSVLLAAGALDPNARLWLLDGKLVELAAWAPVAQRVAGPNGDQAVELLREVRGVMEERYRELLARGLRKIRREDGLPLHLVVCDELAFYLTLPDKSQRQEFAELLRDLVARGRAAGVIVCAATQKPGTDVVPSALRDLFGFRLAMRCTTPQASDTILGQGWASNGADASEIPGAQRGVGYLLAEGERPIRMRGYYLADDDVAAIADRAASQRTDAWLAERAEA